MDYLGSEGGAAHRHHDAARKQRIDKGGGVTDQDVAVACVTRRVVRVVSSGHQRADRLGIHHPSRDARARCDGACEEAVEILGSRPEKGSSADQTDTHDVIGQWDHPKPTVIEQVHSDHALRATSPAGHIAKVSEHGRRIVALVSAFEPEAPEEQGVSARGVDKKAGEPGRRRPVGADRGYSGPPLRPKLDLGHSRAFEHGCAEPAAVVEQQLVEIRTPDVITVIDAEIRVVIKAECRRLSVFVRDDLRTGLVHADAFDLVGNTQAFKQWQIEGEQRFSDVEARESGFFKYDDVPTLLREQRGDGRSGRATANNENIAFPAILHF
jgi:hypothetical protein